MDYKNIINISKKYHYFIKSTSKIIHLSSSNSKTEAKELALDKLKNTIEKLIGKNIIFIKIKLADPDSNNSLKLIGGKIVFEFEDGLIKSTTKIKNNIMGGNNKIYLSEKYINKHQDNLIKDYKKIIMDFYNKKLNQSLIDVNIL